MTLEPESPRRNSKLAAAGLICFLVSIPAAVVGWEARGTDYDWLWPLGALATAVLWIAAAALAIGGIVVICATPDRTKGLGFAVTTLVLVAAGIVWGFVAILSIRVHR